VVAVQPVILTKIRGKGMEPSMTETISAEDQGDEQEQLAREIGEELTDAFVAYVRGDVAFEDLIFGVFDALSDLHVIASGDYVLEDTDESEADGEHEHA
jgi:hypothetical protein